MSPKPSFKPSSKKAQEMRGAALGVLNEGELHRAIVQSMDESGGGYQPPAEAPQPAFRTPPKPEPEQEPEVEAAKPRALPLPPTDDEDPSEPPALVFELPTRRRVGKVSDPNYRGTSLKIHNELWLWARDVKGKSGYDLADLVNLGLAKLKRDWEDPDISPDI